MSAPTGADESRHDRDFLVVGLGGSAGSITSFREFFRHVPADSGMAYVVILHLQPDHESRLSEVLQATSRIPVKQVRETTPVEPDHVYVIPPDRSLRLEDGSLILSDVKNFDERRAPIDIFFRTLAETHDSRAVCVIVSGSGSDGSMGLRRVKEYNGLVLVQDPAEAAFGEMPRNCISTGLVDFVVPVAEMPRRIVEYREQLRTIRIAEEPAEGAAGDEQALMEIFTILRLRTGHDFTNYKRATVLRRIERRMAVRELRRLPAYAELIRERNEEAHALLRELLISVTNFFRDAAVWQKVETHLVPKLAAGKTIEDHLRVWVAGCATGEEAYSVAMLLAERGVPNVQIFATDLDEQAIARARTGWYSEAEVADVDPERLRRFFLREPDGYRVRRELRELVLFAHHNLIKDPPFSHLDFIACRNLLIYLNRAAQKRAMETLHFALEPGGYLLLGTAESVDGAANLFSVEDKEAHIYRSREVERLIHLRPLPYATVPVELSPALETPRPAEPRARERFAPLDLHHRLLEEYAPPSLIVDEQYNIVHLSESAGRFLQFSGGEASTNLLQVARQELRIELRSALFQAAQKRISVAARGLEVFLGDRSARIDLLVRPVLSEDDPARGFFLVIFESPADRTEPAPEPTAVEPGARQLEEELLRVRGQMRATIEQYEVQAEESRAANEELQAMNEELRSTAEELETSQEELQSVNEELQTVNQELKVKIDEITHAGDDLRNLISSTDIGTIFVDRALRVKLFTPRARDLFNLIAGDVGRPLLDITHKLVVDDLGENMERVLDRLQTVEREVATRDGAWYLMRLLPYRTSEDRIDGVVLTFLAVTERHRAEEAREAELEATRVLRDLSARAIAAAGDRDALYRDVVSAALRLTQADAGTLQMLERPGGDLVLLAARGFDEAMTTHFARIPSGSTVSGRRAMDTGVRVYMEFDDPAHPDPDGSLRMHVSAGFLSAVATPLVTRSGSAVGMLSTHWRGHRRPGETELRHLDLLARQAADLIERNLSEDALRASREELEDRVRERTAELSRLSAERQQLLERLVESTEAERRRIARELHDEMGQHLTALRMGLSALRPADGRLDEMMAIIARIDRSIDHLTIELRPPTLDQLGLHGAIASLADELTATGGIRVAVHLEIGEVERFPEALETALYRVAQESLTNVGKHAEAGTASVILRREGGWLRMIVEDDGRGFDPAADAGDAASQGRFGLLGMRERLALVGGTFDIESQPGNGTTVYARVPLPAPRSPS